MVTRKMRWGIERASGCIGFRGERNSGPEAEFGHAKVPKRAPEGESKQDEGR